MPAPEVEYLLEKLKQLLLYESRRIADVKNEVQILENSFRLFKAFLDYNPEIFDELDQDMSFTETVRQIRKIVWQAEDLIDALTDGKAASAAAAQIDSFQRDLDGVAKEAESVGAKVVSMYKKIGVASLPNRLRVRHQARVALKARRDSVVGMEDEAKKLIGYLKEETEQLDVISVIGMPGLGKTTLARKIFRDPAVQFEFPSRIWVCISQEFTKKNVFLAILSEFTTVTDDMRKRNDEDLARLVSTRLESGKFLFVMDDVWTAEDWDELQIVLPRSNKMGKVLVTSRHPEVGLRANRHSVPHCLRFLTQDESWSLLRSEVFGKGESPQELEVLGKLIAEQCYGLPLAIVVIGGILVKHFSTTKNIKNKWRRVSECLTSYEDPGKCLEQIIGLSYDTLPYHLRSCFLYFGMFPGNFEISVEQLTLMWVAEGFIQHKEGIIMEEIARKYLDELIDMDLVRIDKITRDGKVKTCRIHDILRDFCRTEAGNVRENFLQVMKKSSQGSFEPPVEDITKIRRLCIHSNVSYFSTKPYGPRVCSLACFSEEEVNLPTEYISAIAAACRGLRILEIKPIKFSKIPREFYQLVHLRYITISFNLAILPTGFSKLSNLQTLIVYTTSRTLEVKADIWNMMQLRHLKTNASTTLPKPGKGSKSSKEGENLQTIGTVSPFSCTEEVFDRTRYLKKLVVRGRLAIIVDGKNGSNSFDSFGKLGNLEKLKMLNDVFPNAPSEGKLHGLPPPYKFPPKLRSLTLSNTFLDWSHMSILGKLENLEVLKLNDKAFMGKSWEVVDGDFRSLQVVLIGRTDLIVWKASAHHFPRLRRLELRNCEDLLEVPIGFADIPSFQMLDLYRTKFAARSAKKIQEAKNKRRGEEWTHTHLINGDFKLSIFPPDE